MIKAKKRLTAYRKKWERFKESQKGKWTLRILRGLFLIGILSYLGYKLVQIGWQEVWVNLPTQFLFYLFFLLLYFSIPLAEILIYRITWRFNIEQSIPAFIKKRVLNKDILGYSGEVYFFAWAQKNVHQSDVRLAETIRDNNIISAAASNTIALILLGLFFFFGQWEVAAVLNRLNGQYLMMGGVGLVIVVPVLIRFRKYVFSMPLKTTLLIFGIQCVRMTLGQVLQIGQWAVVLPEVPLGTWITYAAVSIVVSRIPFVSNKNLIFLGIGVEIASSFGLPEAAMFGLLGTIAALDKILNFGLFFLLTLLQRRDLGSSR